MQLHKNKKPEKKKKNTRDTLGNSVRQTITLKPVKTPKKGQ